MPKGYGWISSRRFRFVRDDWSPIKPATIVALNPKKGFSGWFVCSSREYYGKGYSRKKGLFPERMNGEKMGRSVLGAGKAMEAWQANAVSPQIAGNHALCNMAVTALPAHYTGWYQPPSSGSHLV